MAINNKGLEADMKAFDTEMIAENSAGMLGVIQRWTTGEERDDLLRRQYAITTQLMTIMGHPPLVGFESAMEGMQKVVDTLDKTWNEIKP